MAKSVYGSLYIWSFVWLVVCVVGRLRGWSFVWLVVCIFHGCNTYKQLTL